MFYYQGEDANAGEAEEGHWEMIKVDVDKYYYVDGMQASSLPNAVVVS